MHTSVSSGLYCVVIRMCSCYNVDTRAYSSANDMGQTYVQGVARSHSLASQVALSGLGAVLAQLKRRLRT